MTADERERQIISTLELLRMYPSELMELVCFVTDDPDTGSVSLRSPLFPIEQEER